MSHTLKGYQVLTQIKVYRYNSRYLIKCKTHNMSAFLSIPMV